jgi:hypothetical protein
MTPRRVAFAKLIRCVSLRTGLRLRSAPRAAHMLLPAGVSPSSRKSKLSPTLLACAMRMARDAASCRAAATPLLTAPSQRNVPAPLPAASASAWAALPVRLCAKHATCQSRCVRAMERVNDTPFLAARAPERVKEMPSLATPRGRVHYPFRGTLG